MGSNSDGIWNEEGTSIEVKILPPPWKTWWAYSLYILILTAVVFRFLRSKRILALKVEERTKELKSAQEQLIQSAKLASLGLLASGVAHGINNPISTVNTTAYNLRRDLKKLKSFLVELAGDEADKEILNTFDEEFSYLLKYVSTIKEDTSRIGNFVRDLVAFSSQSNGKMRKTRILEGLKTTINLVESNFIDKVEFVRDFRADLELDCNQAELNQVFMNIIINACQFIAEKQRIHNDDSKGILTIQAREEKDELVISFEDNGTGMTEEVKKKIFDPFFTTKPEGEGIGLGLSIAYGIIKKHGGQIDVLSEKGKGTTVTLYLPLEKGERPTTQREGC
jgi:signal transduction histidine kinase